MESTNNEINLGMPGSPTGAETVSEPPGPEVTGNTSVSGVIELPEPKKRKWTQAEYRLVWKCYVKSEKEKRGFMKRMLNLWETESGRVVTAKQLRTQVDNIVKRNLLTSLEREEINNSLKRESKNGAQEQLANEEMRNKDGEFNEREGTNGEGEDVQVGEQPRERGTEMETTLTGNEQEVLSRLRELMMSNTTRVVPALKKMDRKRLLHETALVNKVVEQIEVTDITEVNRVLYSASYVVAERLGKMKDGTRDNRNKNNEPWWKRRVEENIVQWWKDLSRVEARRKGELTFTESEVTRMNRK